MANNCCTIPGLEAAHSRRESLQDDATALDRIGLKILDGHLHGCVREAMIRGGKETEAKTTELLEARRAVREDALTKPL